MAKEQTIQTDIMKMLRKKYNAYCFTVVSAGTSGIPDIISCIDGLFFAVEAKKVKQKARVLQQYNIDCIREAGGLAMVADSVEKVDLYVQAHILKEN